MSALNDQQFNTGRLRMYRNVEIAQTLCPGCHKRATGRGEDLTGFEPIRSNHPSIGAGSIEVCTDCAKTIVNSLPKDEWL
jgi:hypothetical protein